MRSWFLLLLLCGLPTTAAASDYAPGDDVRVAMLDGRLLEGRLAAADEDRVRIETEAGIETAPLDSVQALWVRGRGTGRGMKIGAIAGGIGMGAYGALIGMVFRDDDVSPLATGTFGAAFGVVSGGLTGALLGAALPRWHLVRGEPGEAPRPRDDPRRRPRRLIGGLALGGGYAEALGGTDAGGTAWQLQLFSGHRSGLRHGLEFMTAQPGQAAQPYDDPYGYHTRKTTLWHAGWRGELPVIAVQPGRLVPFLAGGLAAYSWQDAYLGYSLGGGVRVDPADRGPGLIVEVRRHDNIQNLTETDPAHWTAMASLVLHW